jgi:protein-disulfide isomerase
MLLGAAAVAVLAGGAIVLAVVLSGGSSPTPKNVPAVGRLAGGLPGSAAVWQLFHGIPQAGDVLGSADAPVTMVEYVDLQCPYCREFETAVLPQLVTHDVRPGGLRIEMRLLAFIGPDSQRGRSAALAAGQQGRQFDFAELLYFNQGTENTGWLDEQMIVSAAGSIPGLRVPTMLAASTSGAVAAREARLDAQAHADGVTSTPTVLVGKTGTPPTEVALASPSDLATVQAAIMRAGG